MGKSNLPWVKVYTDKLLVMEQTLSVDLACELIFAIAHYADDGTVRDVDPRIEFPFAEWRLEIDGAARKYEQKCATNAENGAKGGRAKAERRKASFKPPSKMTFKNAVFRFANEMDEHVDPYHIDVFYEELENASWKIGGEPIRSRDDWESAIWEKLISNHHRYDAFEYLFGNYAGLRDKNGKTLVNEFLDDLEQTVQEEETGRKQFVIEGSAFLIREWKEAVNKYLPIWAHEKSIELNAEGSEQTNIDA